MGKRLDTIRKNRRHDWVALESEYVQGNITLRAMSEKHNIAFGVISRQAVNNDWYEKREQFRDRLRTETENQTITKAAADISDERAYVLKIIDAVLNKGAEQLIGRRDPESGNFVVPPTMKVRAGDLLEAGKLKLVLLGEIIDRKEIKGDGFNVNVFDWRALADKYGLTEQDVIAEAKRLVEALESAVDSSRVESHRQEKEV